MKSSKLIIKNESSADDFTCLHLVMSVIKLGRISKNDTQYCYVCASDNYVVYTDLTKNKTDVFTVRDNHEITK